MDGSVGNGVSSPPLPGTSCRMRYVRSLKQEPGTELSNTSQSKQIRFWRLRVGYSKWMRTISGVVPTRIGGPQVPAPLEV